MLRKTIYPKVCMVYFLLLTCLCMVTGAIAADPLNLSINGKKKSEDAVKIRIHKNGKASLQILDNGYDKNNKKTLKLTLTKFQGQHDHEVNIVFQNGANIYTVTNADTIIDLNLDCSETTYFGPYKGVLVVKTENEGPEYFNLSLHRDEPAWLKTLVTGDSQTAIVQADENGKAVISLSTGDLGELGKKPKEPVRKLDGTVNGSGDSKQEVMIALSSFISSSGEVEVKFASGPGITPTNKGKTVIEQIQLPEGKVAWELDASEIKDDTPHYGTFTISTVKPDDTGRNQSEKILIRMGIELKRKPMQKTAVLIAELTHAALTCKTFWEKCDPDPIEVQLTSEISSQKIIGLWGKWEEPLPGYMKQSGPINFRIATGPLEPNQKEKDRKKVLIDLYYPPSINATDIEERSIQPNTRATLFVDLPELKTGQHDLPLILHSMNEKDNQGEKVILKVTVKRTIWIPIFILLVAMISSYLVTTGYQNTQKFHDLEDRIEGLEKTWWLEAESSNLFPMVQAKTIIAYAKRALGQFKFERLWSNNAMTKVSENLDRLETKYMPHLERLSRLWINWHNSHDCVMVRHRACQRIRKISSDMNRFDFLTQDLDDDVIQDIKGLEDWIIQKNKESDYKDDLNRTLTSLNGCTFLKGYQKCGSELIDKSKEKLKKLLDPSQFTLYMDKLKKIHEDLVSINQSEADKIQEILDELNKIDFGADDKLLKLHSKILNGAYSEGFSHALFPAISQLRRKIERKEEIIGIMVNNFSNLPSIIKGFDKDNKINKFKEIVDTSKELKKTLMEIFYKPRVFGEYLESKLPQDTSSISYKEAIEIDRSYYAPLKLLQDLGDKIIDSDDKRKEELIKIWADKIWADDPRSGENRILLIFSKEKEWVWNDLVGTQIHVDHFNDNPPDKIEPFSFKKFKVVPTNNGNPSIISEAFTFQNRLVYKWLFKMWNKKDSHTIKRVTKVPTVAAFFSLREADVEVSVKVCKDKGSSNCHTHVEKSKDDEERGPLSFKTEKSTRLLRIKGAVIYDVFIFLLAYAVALFGVLKENQFQSAITDPASSLILLFMWGVGIDQIKNQLQKFTERRKN